MFSAVQSCFQLLLSRNESLLFSELSFFALRRFVVLLYWIFTSQRCSFLFSAGRWSRSGYLFIDLTVFFFCLNIYLFIYVFIFPLSTSVNVVQPWRKEPPHSSIALSYSQLNCCGAPAVVAADACHCCCCCCCGTFLDASVLYSAALCPAATCRSVLLGGCSFSRQYRPRVFQNKNEQTDAAAHWLVAFNESTLSAKAGTLVSKHRCIIHQSRVWVHAACRRLEEAELNLAQMRMESLLVLNSRR